MIFAKNSRLPNSDEQQAGCADSQKRQHGPGGFGKRDVGILQFQPLHHASDASGSTNKTMPASESQK